MSDPIVTLILMGVVAPLVLSFILYVVAWRPWQKDADPNGEWAGPLAVGASVILGYVALHGFPDFFPDNATARTVYVAFGVAGAGLLYVHVTNRIARWAFRIIVVGAGMWVLLEPMIGGTWSTGVGYGYVAGFTLAGALLWRALDILAERHNGYSLPLVLAVTAGGGALVVALAASITTGQMAGAMAIAGGMPAVIAWWRGGVSSRGVVAAFAPLIAFLWALSYAYADVHWLIMVLVTLAPVVALAGEWAPVKKRKAWVRATLRVAMVTVPIVLGLAISETGVLDSPSGDEDVSESGSYRPY